MLELILKRIQECKVLLLLIVADVVVMSFSIFFADNGLFNIDFENNLPTFYQGMKLILLSFLSLFVFFRSGSSKGFERYFWLFFFLMFLVLGVDEIFQIHENISLWMKELFGQNAQGYENLVYTSGYASTTWLPYYSIAILLATVIIFVYVLRFLKSGMAGVWYLVVGWLLLLGVIVVEYINTLPQYMFQEGYYELVVLEESLEMIGVSILFFFVYISFSAQYGRGKKLLKKVVDN